MLAPTLSGAAFAAYDRRYYAPLGLALGAGYVATLIAGINP